MSDDDKWDSENFEDDIQPKSGPIGLMSNQWDGEDEEEEVKDSWDADDPEDEEQEETKETDTAKAVQVKKNKKTLQSKIEEKERKLKEEMLAITLKQERENMTPEEKVAEKRKQQQLQEEADLEVAKQLLGVSLQNDFSELNTKEQFDKYKDDIIRQIGNATKSQNFPGFVDQLVQALCVHLSATDLKKIHSWVGNLQIEKNRMEQGTKSKKKGKGKVKLQVEEETEIYSHYNEDLYDDFM